MIPPASRIEITLRKDTLERIKQLCIERELEDSTENISFFLDYFASLALEQLKALQEQKK